MSIGDSGPSTNLQTSVICSADLAKALSRLDVVCAPVQAALGRKRSRDCSLAINQAIVLAMQLARAGEISEETAGARIAAAVAGVDPQNWLTAPEAAKVLNITVRRLQRIAERQKSADFVLFNNGRIKYIPCDTLNAVAKVRVDHNRFLVL